MRLDFAVAMVERGASARRAHWASHVAVVMRGHIVAFNQPMLRRSVPAKGVAAAIEYVPFRPVGSDATANDWEICEQGATAT